MADTSPQSDHRFSIRYIIAAGAVLLAASALISRLAAQDTVSDAPTPLPVSVVTASIEDSYRIRREFAGRASARRRGALAFDLSGRLDAVLVDDGDMVAAGAPLARLETDRLKTRKERLEAELAEARANFVLADRTLARTKTLFEQGHVSNQRLDSAQAELDAALGRVQTATATLRSVRIDLDKSVLKAPYDLVVEHRLLDEGVVVAAGAPVLDVVEDGPMDAQFGLPVEFARRLKSGADFAVMAEQNKSVPATVKTVSPAVRGETRTVLVTVRLDKDAVDHIGIADGQTLDLRMDDVVQERGAWLPLTALTADVRGLWRVYRVARNERGDQIIHSGTVQVIYTEADRVFVSGTIADGDRIVSGGIDRVVPGIVVRITESGPDSGANSS